MTRLFTRRRTFQLAAGAVAAPLALPSVRPLVPPRFDPPTPATRHRFRGLFAVVGPEDCFTAITLVSRADGSWVVDFDQVLGDPNPVRHVLALLIDESAKATA